MGGQVGEQRSLGPYLGWVLFALALTFLPLVAQTGTLRIFIFAFYLAIFAMSWDFLSGRTGYISFGHPFLIGIGSYATAILSYRYGVPLYLSIPAAVLITMVAGTCFFLPALRVRGSYFALVTLAFMELMYQLTQVIRPDITGGTRGISGLKSILTGAVSNYYLTLALMLAIALLLWTLSRTRLGLALSAIGMDEDAVRGSGLDATKLKLFAFMTSAFVAGVGGAFYVHYLGSIAPRALFDINFVFTIIVAVLIGGAGTIVGPIIGAFFLTFLLEYLRPFIPGTERYFIYGIIALLLYVYKPKGIIAIVEEIWTRLRPTITKGGAHG
jgi:branched-chain amino acid transport system permease protein